MEPRVIIPNPTVVLDHITDDKAYGILELYDLRNSLKMQIKGSICILERIINSTPTFKSRVDGKEFHYLRNAELQCDNQGEVILLNF
jgi:hypothetical protein